ncbi:MAG: hypothetical protein WKH97_13130 [Casimicrobiaceae bacterium]
MSVGRDMRRVDAIVNAVLYEGYMLYPYRPSSVKNRQRWTFGGVYPQAYSAAQNGAEPWIMQTQCLVQGDARTELDVDIGFLHLVERQVGALEQPLRVWPGLEQPKYRNVEVLEVGERRYYTWQEATPQRVNIGKLPIATLSASACEVPFAFPGHRELEPLTAASGEIVGVLVRTQQAIEGKIEVRAEPVAEATFRLTIRIVNITPMPAIEGMDRNAASPYALVSCHTILNVHAGEFVSLMDPAQPLAAAASECANIGTWPVMVGEGGERDTLLSSPIILYDYPQIAPESPGDLFDATEIDEILTLRILAMTDEEKREMAAVDDRARALLERTEQLAPEQLQKLHGTMRHLRPVEPAHEPEQDEAKAPWEELDAVPRLAYLRVNGVELRVGDPVRLKPRGNADIFDIALSDKLATIESIERDFENRVHVAVTIDDDPGKDFGLERMPGHRFFFGPDEVEPLERQGSAG